MKAIMIINVGLFIAGAVALTKSVLYMDRDWRLNSRNRLLSFMGAWAFVWCAGYALMGMEESFSAAFYMRNVGLLGVIAFMTTEFWFLTYVSGTIKKGKKLILAVISVASVVDYILFSRGGAQEFTRVGDRTCYYANESFARNVHSIYLLILIVVISWMGYLWYKRVELKREKRLVLNIFVVNFCIVVAAIPDTFIPLMGKPSLPTSGFGGVLAYLVICYMEEKYNAFSISASNLSQYIYRYVTVPVLVFSHDDTIAFVNDYGTQFLGLEGKEVKRLDQIFEITGEESNRLFYEIKAHEEVKQEYKLKSLHDQKRCRLNFTCIRDSYGETYCIICFVNDMSDEIKKVEALKLVRNELQREVDEKTRQAEWAIFQAIATVANAIDAKDEYTKGHSVRVAEYSAELARAIGWNDTQIENLHSIALLHDIGKIGVPDSVLNKPERLTEMEVELIKSHTTIGGEILKDITLIDHLSDGAMYHHERFDGNGYPKRLKGEEIPIEARIICIADAYDAMNTDRVYRNKLPLDVIQEQLRAGKEVQFDPELVDIFLMLLSAGKLSGDEAVEVDEHHASERTGRLLQSLIHKNMQKHKESDGQDAVKDLGERDYLTGVYERQIGEGYTEAIMQESAGCLAVIDIDNLRRVNSTYGHLAGDSALKLLSQILLEHKQDGIVARYGGDEFLFYMKMQNQEEIQKVLEEILYSYKCQRDAQPSLKRTSLSVGLCRNRKGDSYEQIYQNASKALYNVKQTGKSRYGFYQDTKRAAANYASIDLRRLVEVLEHDNQAVAGENMEQQELKRIASYITKYSRNYTGTVKIAMITICHNGTEEKSLEQQEYLMRCMHVAIMNNLGDTKAATRFSSVQYLAIFLCEEQQAVETVNQIFKRFYRICNDRDIDVSYEMKECKMR